MMSVTDPASDDGPETGSVLPVLMAKDQPLITGTTVLRLVAACFPPPIALDIIRASGHY